MRVLIIEDQINISDAIARGLRKSGYAVDTAFDGATGLRSAQACDYDVMILDLMIPVLDGLSVLQQLRAGGSQTHVLVLTAKDTLEDRVRGLRMGADDYLAKPFAFEELLARVEALVRRRHVMKNPIVEYRGLRIDTATRVVSRDGEPLDLPPRQYALLQFFLLHRGVVVSRSDIETHLYDAMVEPMSNVIDASVYALRKKIDVAGEPSLIQTRRGMGYLMPAEEIER